jgi:hypothetical protein
MNWISELSPASGQGSAEVAFRVATNPLASTRQGDIIVNGTRLGVLQAASPCRIEITPGSQRIAAAGAVGSATVTTASGCSWIATSQASWLSLTQPASGDGNGTIGFSIAPNSSGERSATVSVAEQTFTVTQSGAAVVTTCTYAIAATSQSIAAPGGAGTPVAVSTSSGCAWTASSNASWLTITSGTAGTGEGTVAFSVAANNGGARSGTLTIGGQTFTATQVAVATCTYAIAPTSQSIAAPGGAGTPVAVSTSSGCAWTASSNASWLTITSGTAGTGNGTVAFSVAANTGAARSGTLAVGGQTFTVTQAAVATCSYAIAPTSQSIGKSGGTGTPVAVSTSSGCTWTASSNASWLTITSGTAGTGNGTVAFSVAANTGAARSGTLTVAGQTLTVSQRKN